MAETSKIEWTEATWNPITGCSMVSPGCTNCYAMRLAGGRLRNHPSRRGLTRETATGPVWTGEVRLNEAALDQPLRWKRPRMIFVVAHGDLFHESVPDEWIDKVFLRMRMADQHTYQVLTKRPERMCEYFHGKHRTVPDNVWLGTSVEDQRTAEERIPWLIGTKTPVRWLSCEPLLGPVSLTHLQRQMGYSNPNLPGPAFEPVINWIDWVVIGGESGPRARPLDEAWVYELIDECQRREVPVFVKQLSQASQPDIWKDFDKWPAGLRMRAWPRGHEPALPKWK